MTKHAQLLSLATFTALSLLSTAPRANDNQTEERAAPLSCAEATQVAYFNRQLSMTDGDTSPEVAVPAECQRQIHANSDDAK